MTKEEKIKEAWGDYFEHFGEYAVKHALENNGFCYVPSFTLGLILKRHGEEWLDVNDELMYRPKSLQGIENNNGWIKIESEDDLPKEDGLYWIIDGDNGLFLSEFKKDFMQFFTDDFAYNDYELTHYQPIEKPEPPIY